MKNRTTLVIAHRLSTIINSKKIIVLENGSVKETGNHEELIKSDGIYKKLYDREF
jgi:ATP-binding cassette subfamily B protein